MAKKKAKKVVKKKNPLRTVSEIMGSAGLDEMVEQYLATGLWSSTDYDGQPLDSNYSTSDISDEFYEQSKKDCQEFWDKTYNLYEEDELDFGTIGHDFWLTRNNHGAGFWDGDYLNGFLLTKIALEFGEVDLNEHIVTDEDEVTKSNPTKEVDEILVRDVYLTLNNESEFYKNYLVPLYKSAEKFYKKGQYNSKNFINALQKGINEYTLHGPSHFSYNRKYASIIPKHEREAVAKLFEEYLLGELELGNGWLASNPSQYAVKISPRALSDLLIAVNSTNGNWKYPIGNKELTEKLKNLEHDGVIEYDEYYSKWVKAKRKKSNPTRQINFNNYREHLNEDDIDQIVELVCQRCKASTYNDVRKALTLHSSLIPHLGIFERLIKENGGWRYIAAQSYPEEIKSVRELMIKRGR